MAADFGFVFRTGVFGTGQEIAFADERRATLRHADLAIFSCLLALERAEAHRFHGN